MGSRCSTCARLRAESTAPMCSWPARRPQWLDASTAWVLPAALDGWSTSASGCWRTRADAGRGVGAAGLQRGRSSRWGCPVARAAAPTGSASAAAAARALHVVSGGIVTSSWSRPGARWPHAGDVARPARRPHRVPAGRDNRRAAAGGRTCAADGGARVRGARRARRRTRGARGCGGRPRRGRRAPALRTSAAARRCATTARPRHAGGRRIGVWPTSSQTSRSGRGTLPSRPPTPTRPSPPSWTRRARMLSHAERRSRRRSSPSSPAIAHRRTMRRRGGSASSPPGDCFG